MADTLREEFEAWTTGPEGAWIDGAVWRDSNGNYGEVEIAREWEIWQAATRAALASRPAEADDKIPRESNDALIALARYWKLNGDWMTCKGCRRSLIASRDGEDLAHGDGCKYWDQQHPWAQLRELITRRPAPAGAAQ